MRPHFDKNRVNVVAALDVEVVAARCEVSTVVAVAAVALGTSIAVADRTAVIVGVAVVEDMIDS
jgi:hypothetical protein